MIHIKGNRIDLRTFTREEYHEYRQNYISDPIMDPGTYIYNKEQVDHVYNLLLERQSWYPIVGIFRGDGTIIGSISFKRIDYEKSRCELGIALTNDQYKGQGYGTEAFSLAIEYAFHELNLRYIYADTMGSNKRMQHIFEKFHFSLLDRVVNCYDMHDRWEDKLNYVLVRAE